jgi:glycosyltransferase involved in cell wall biosynthesis
MALAPLATRGTLVLAMSPYGAIEAGALPSQGSVVTRTGYIEGLGNLYRAADVYVFPTVDPNAVIGTPLSVFEALANGTPVVARRSEALERWAHLDGLTLTDSDEEMVVAATQVAARPASSIASLRRSECGKDLRPCVDFT